MANTRKQRHVFSKKQFRKMHKKSKHKRRQSNTRKLRKGGEYLGKGAFGIVYGGPRLPCEDETYYDIKRNIEVSKIFKTQLDANNEWTSIENLQKIMKKRDYDMKKTDYNDLQKHVIIPYKKCKINLNAVDDLNSVFKTNNWMMNKYGKFNENIFNSIHTLPHGYEYKDMIISERGGNSLYNVFFNISDGTIQYMENFIDAVTKLQSILKGIKILQDNNFIHGDIKSGNCIEHNNTYKLIDIAEVIHIPLIENVVPKPFAFGYSPWPSIIIYSIFFDNDYEINNNINIKLTPADLKYLYNKGHDNDKDYCDYLFRSIIAPFLINSKNGFTTQQIDKIFTICKALVSQKTCGIINLDIEEFRNEYEDKPDEYDEDMWNNDIFEIMKAKIYQQIPKYDEEYLNNYVTDSDKFLEKFNKIFQNIEEMNPILENKNDIKKHDIVVFESNYTTNNQTEDTTNNQTEETTNNQITNRGRIFDIKSNGKNDKYYIIEYYAKMSKAASRLYAATQSKQNVVSTITPPINREQIKQKINRDELKLDLFKRIDIYSFGIMVLEVIYNYINRNHRMMNKDLRKMIVQLYDFVEVCCIQTEKCADIDELVKRYEKIITDYDKNMKLRVETPNFSDIITYGDDRRSKYKKKTTPGSNATQVLPPIKP